ncbi:MAG: alanine racemase [Salinarimonas sp.]|nr:alanine racemase [Salinarimonas sp.]
MIGDFAIIPPEEAGAVLTIDLDAYASNWRLLRDRAGGADCAAVVKANAYGIGIEMAVPKLLAAGCRTFYVAHLAEARRVRALTGEAVIYVLNGFLPGTAPVYAAHGLRPVLGSRAEIDEWAGFAAAHPEAPPAAIHIDTGMNRLGLPPEEVEGVARTLPFTPALILTHLASAEDRTDPSNARQLADFTRLRGHFPEIPASFCNSAGTFIESVAAFDQIRAGVALYGANPTPGQPNPMREVVRLEARILQLRDVPDGAAAGYNGKWTARGPRRLATLSIGYADGYLRSASGWDVKAGQGIDAGIALVGGVACPFAGSVSMDLIVIDVTDAPADALARGKTVVMIGDGLSVDEVAARAGTIPYEILTSLGRRYARIYRNA